MANKYDLGDIVQLRSEARGMTITNVFGNDNYECSWMSDACEVQQCVFHADSLVLTRARSADGCSP